MKRFAATVAAMSLGLAAGPLMAATEATATTDLNIRSGPGPWYDVVGVIGADATASVDGCLDEANWCQVSYNGVSGWAYGEYLTASVGDAPMALSMPETRQSVQVGTVTYVEPEGSTVAASAGFGAVSGALIGGPVGAVIGAIAGGTAGAVAAPDPQVVTYVQTNPLDPIYLDGEVVVGAGLPQEVELVTIPDTKYSYVYVNGVPVIVESTDRRIVRIVR